MTHVLALRFPWSRGEIISFSSRVWVKWSYEQFNFIKQIDKSVVQWKVPEQTIWRLWRCCTDEDPTPEGYRLRHKGTEKKHLQEKSLLIKPTKPQTNPTEITLKASCPTRHLDWQFHCYYLASSQLAAIVVKHIHSRQYAVSGRQRLKNLK